MEKREICFIKKTNAKFTFRVDQIESDTKSTNNCSFAIDNNNSTLRAKAPNEIYQSSMLGRMPTFFDVLQMNKHLGCFGERSMVLCCDEEFVSTFLKTIAGDASDHAE